MTLLEKAPPGWEDWILHRKAENPGKDPGVFYALAWQKYNAGETYRKPKAKKDRGKIVRRPGPKSKAKKPAPKKKRRKQKSLREMKRMLEDFAAVPFNQASSGEVEGLVGDPPVPIRKQRKRTPIFRRGK